MKTALGYQVLSTRIKMFTIIYRDYEKICQKQHLQMYYLLKMIDFINLSGFDLVAIINEKDYQLGMIV